VYLSGQVWDFMALPVSLENEKETNEMLVARCQTALKNCKEADELAAELDKESKADRGQYPMD